MLKVDIETYCPYCQEQEKHTLELIMVTDSSAYGPHLKLEDAEGSGMRVMMSRTVLDNLHMYIHSVLKG